MTIAMRKWISVLILAMGLAGCATLKLNPPGLLAAYDDLSNGRFERASERLDRLAQDDPAPEIESEIAYLRARILDEQGDLPAARIQYRRVVDDYPRTPDSYLAAKRLQELTESSPAP